MSDAASNNVVSINRRVKAARAFVDEMARQGIHVGFGAPPTCCTCGLPFPCDASERYTVPVDPDREAATDMTSEQFLAALANLRGIVEQLSLVDIGDWTERDEAVDCWDQLDVLQSTLSVMVRQHAVQLARTLPPEYLHPRAGVIHSETEVTVRWDGSGVLGALSAKLVDPETGEVVEAVPTATLRQVVPAASPGKVSSKWNTSGLKGAGIDPDKYREATYGARLVRRGPRRSPHRVAPE